MLKIILLIMSVSGAWASITESVFAFNLLVFSFFLFSLIHSFQYFPKRYAFIFLALCYTGALIGELWGTNIGLFGAHYSYQLQNWPVPNETLLMLYIPFLWFTLIYPAQVITSFMHGRHSVWHIGWAFVGAFITTSIDLVLDPVAMKLGLWGWEKGPTTVFDVPVQNTISWLLGVFLILYFANFWFRRLKVIPKNQELNFRFLPILAYGIFSFVIVCLAQSMELKVLGIFSMGIPLILSSMFFIQKRRIQNSY